MITNLTPHQITIIGQDGTTVVREIPSSGVARAAVTSTPAGILDGVPLVAQTYGAPEGLPDPAPGTYLVVSLVTAQAAERHGRDTGDLLLAADLARDDAGRVIGCRALAPYSAKLAKLLYDDDSIWLTVGDDVLPAGDTDDGDTPESVLRDEGYAPVGAVDDWEDAGGGEYVGLVRELIGYSATVRGMVSHWTA